MQKNLRKRILKDVVKKRRLAALINEENIMFHKFRGTGVKTVVPIAGEALDGVISATGGGDVVINLKGNAAMNNSVVGADVVVKRKNAIIDFATDRRCRRSIVGEAIVLLVVPAEPTDPENFISAAPTNDKLTRHRMKGDPVDVLVVDIRKIVVSLRKVVELRKLVVGGDPAVIFIDHVLLTRVERAKLFLTPQTHAVLFDFFAQKFNASFDIHETFR